jgi:hypothetical protein
LAEWKSGIKEMEKLNDPGFDPQPGQSFEKSQVAFTQVKIKYQWNSAP